MPYYDLTHPMHSGMPVFPGDSEPLFVPADGLATDGYRETRLYLDSHTGTHVDAPAHMLISGKFLDQYPVSRFTGTAIIVRIPPGSRQVGKSFLKTYAEDIGKSDFILFETGWGRYWGTEDYSRHFPVMSEDAARWLGTWPLKGIGIDAISVDPMDSETWPVHHILFDADLIIVENMVFPEGIILHGGTFHCFPLNFANADGSPVRAVLETPHPGPVS